jgi:hypothetical protein
VEIGLLGEEAEAPSKFGVPPFFVTVRRRWGLELEVVGVLLLSSDERKKRLDPRDATERRQSYRVNSGNVAVQGSSALDQSGGPIGSFALQSPSGRTEILPHKSRCREPFFRKNVGLFAPF